MKFTKKSLEAIVATDRLQLFFDDDLPGLAIRVTPKPKGSISFYYTYRFGKGRGALKNWLHIGSYPKWSPEQARQKVKELAARVVAGIDPARELQEAKEAKTLAQVLKIFLDEYAAKLKNATRTQYEGLARLYILPELGKLKIEAVAHRDIAKLHHELRDRPSMANRSAALLSVFFNWCAANGYRERGSNPVPGLKKFKENKRTEFLTAEQLGAIGAALADLERGQKISPIIAAALRLVMLTGARKTEILSLKWTYLDLESGLLKLPDSKTGFKVIQLPAPALEVLKSMKELKMEDEYVFPTFKAKGLTPHLSELRPTWVKVLAKAGVEGRWRVHDLRHAYASMAVNSGASLPMIGALLGHSQPSTTQRYAHLAKNPVRDLAEKTAGLIAEAWDKAPLENENGIIKFRPRRVAGI